VKTQIDDRDSDRGLD